MTDVRRLLDAVRNELRTTVLPKVDGDYERSVVVAMLGILGDLREIVVLDERPIIDEVERLRTASSEWIAALGSLPLAARLRESCGKAAAAPTAAERRASYLEIAETLVRALWTDPELEALRRELLPSIRRSLRS